LPPDGVKKALFGRVIQVGENENFHSIAPKVIEIGVLHTSLKQKRCHDSGLVIIFNIYGWIYVLREC
jgi:hypothetical protein